METWTAIQSGLNSKSVQERTNFLPKHLVHILELATKLNLKLKKVWLYGSRARGDARENSDFDLAFLVGENKNWSEFKLLIHDDPPAVFKYDLVSYEECDKALRQSIDNEGLVIYESK